MRNSEPMQLDASAVCEPNIGPKEQRKRLLAGLCFSVLTLGILMVVLTYSSNRWMRLGLLPFYYAVTICFFQVQEKTCTFLAKRGMRKFGRNVERIADESRLVTMRRQMKRVNVKSLITTLLLTLITLAL